MKHTGIKAFGLSFILTVAIALPLFGSFVLYANWQGKQQAETAQKEQSGVPIGTASKENDITVLVTVTGEAPAFILLRFNAVENKVDICPVPAESVLLAPSGTTLLATSYKSAGPARAAALLGQTLNIAIDRYLAITPETIAKVWGKLEPPRVNMTGLLEQSELAQLGLSGDPVLSVNPGEATAFLQQRGLAPIRLARLRAAVWETALRQQLKALATSLPAALRKNNGSLLTDFSVPDFYTLEDTLAFLARAEVDFSAEPIPGRYDTANGRYEFGEDSIALAKRVFVPAEMVSTPIVQVSPPPEAEGEPQEGDELFLEGEGQPENGETDPQGAQDQPENEPDTAGLETGESAGGVPQSPTPGSGQAGVRPTNTPPMSGSLGGEGSTPTATPKAGSQSPSPTPSLPPQTGAAAGGLG